MGEWTYVVPGQVPAGPFMGRLVTYVTVIVPVMAG